MRGIRKLTLILILLMAGMEMPAQRFFNLTSEEVRIDSVLPHFTYSIPLGDNYRDSVYTVSIAYPEFIDMTDADIRHYNRISGSMLPTLPTVTQRVVVCRKKGSLELSFCPLVYRDNKYQILVSFMLDLKATSVRGSSSYAKAATRAGTVDRYAAHSVLAQGTWAKIRVSSSGVYQLTEALVRQAGFTDINKVKIYGYGGALQPAALNGEDLIRTDDLKEVPTCKVNGKRLFYAKGPVSWNGPQATVRTRNPYSSYGYYFLTQDDAKPQIIDSTAFLASFYPSADDYHTLHEIDNFAWYHGGRNLFQNDPIAEGSSKSYTLAAPSRSRQGLMTIAITAGVNSSAVIALNDSTLGSIDIRLGSYDKGNSSNRGYKVGNLSATNTIKISTTSGGPIRLDYISFTVNEPRSAPSLAGGTFPSPDYVYNITNQDHHADGPADMVIIIPTSQKLRAQAERLKAFHEQYDHLRVNIVPSDELINEFGGGTPDANAYRRYLKMLYDRATNEADMPRYLLLFGDCVWDNRMLTPECRNLNPDDYLLCYESENSFNEVTCYVDDGFFCLLDDGEGANLTASDKLDVAVGRFPVTTEAEAKIMVDKTINYIRNGQAGAWQNTLVFMGDDGDNNLHMRDLNEVADGIANRYPGFIVRKVMWDAYKRETSSTGNSYPEVTRVLKQYQQAGALIMDYAGHGIEYQISHEGVLKLDDFKKFTNTNLPLWVTASCDIMPFDGVAETIGETAVLNERGGAVAFFGTTRTVYTNYNKLINMAFLRQVLSVKDGKPVTIGEAQMVAKNALIASQADMTENKLQYALLGDPALALKLPVAQVVLDSINGVPTGNSSTAPMLKAGSTAVFSGHVEGYPDFRGVLTATIRDTRERIECRNNGNQASYTFAYYDRPKTLFHGSDSVRNGRFRFTFAVPRDINYASGSGMVNFYAVTNDHTLQANGFSDAFTIDGGQLAGNDSIGPSIYCYLNSPSFVNGGKVNPTPYFVAQVTDEDGINTTGSGIGHDLQLVIDGNITTTYNLNEQFVYDFGSYTSGNVYFSLPQLVPGRHHLRFRAWDVLNNSSTAELTFEVVNGLEPSLFDVDVTRNPATTSTTFILTHDRTGSPMDVQLEVYDLSGRMLWRHRENGVSSGNAYTVDWNLTTDNGRRLQTGVYVYRAQISCDGSQRATKAKKLIVIGNN